MFQFEGMADFLQMSGHGPYVWTAYLISFVLMSMLLISPLYRKRQILRQISRDMRREMAQEKARHAPKQGVRPGEKDSKTRG